VQSHIIDLSEVVQSEIDRRTQDAVSDMSDILQWVIGDTRRLQLHAVEAALLPRLLCLGVKLLLLSIVCRLPRTVPAAVRIGRGYYFCSGMVTAPVRSRFGEFWAPRPEYELVHGEGPKRLSPVDREIGLAAGRMSLGVHLLVAKLVARMPFEECREILELFGEYAPATRSIHGVVDSLGPQAASFMEGLPAPEDDGEILVIEVDHKGAPHMTPEEHVKRRKKHVKLPRGLSKRELRRWRRRRNPRPRRQVGDKSKNARMAAIGVVYTLRRLPDGSVEGPINRRVFGTFRGTEVLFRLLQQEASKRGYGAKRSIFLADGERKLWDLWREFFPGATPCVDWFHLSEYLWEAVGAIYRSKPKAKRKAKRTTGHGAQETAKSGKKLDPGQQDRKLWVESRQAELERGDVDAVLSALETATASIPSTGPGNKGRKKSLQKAITYIKNHREFMPYRELIADGLVIGTGNIEGVARAVGARLDGPGMRWSRERSEHMLALVCVDASGEWEAFDRAVIAAHECLETWRVDRITPNRPMTPHKALKKAA
jgi:hypothetical protein